MKVHMLMTPEVGCKKPKEAKIIMDFGQIDIFFGEETISGLHCVIEAPVEIIKNWLGQFDGIPIGNGSPIQEQFQIKHIKL